MAGTLDVSNMLGYTGPVTVPSKNERPFEHPDDIPHQKVSPSKVTALSS